jgi:hypothetical protein
MPNVLVEFEGSNGFVNHVECINTDYLKRTNNFPDEARFAGHIDGAIESDEKHCNMTPEVYRTYLHGNFRNKVVLDIPYMVEEHIVVSVKF